MTDKTRQDSGSTHIIRYALELGLLWIDGDGRDKVREALDALDTLESQLEAIGAGGVSGPLVGRAAPPTAQAEGWRLVPVEPTVEQEWEGKQAALRGLTMAEACKIYKAMIAKAPTPPTSAEGVEHG